MAFLLAVAGLFLLVIGANWLVGGASRIAYTLGVSELVVGLTIVAIGTSAPELAISVATALQIENGSLTRIEGSELILGNVIGSNISNLGLILGLSALVAAILVSQSILREEYAWMAGASLAIALLTLDGNLNRLEGLLLLVGLVVFSAVQYRVARRQSQSAQNPTDGSEKPAPLTMTSLALNGAQIIGGSAFLIVGSDLLVRGATELARELGVSDYVIGLTLVAIGTSLPELVTSMVASLRKESALIVGNILGSNIYNLLLILSAGALVTDLSVDDSVRTLQIPLLLGITFLLVPIIRRESQISRLEGGVLLAAYAGSISLTLALQG